MVKLKHARNDSRLTIRFHSIFGSLRAGRGRVWRRAAIVLLASGAPFWAAAQAPDAEFPSDVASIEEVERWIQTNLDITGFVGSGWSPNALFFLSTEQPRPNLFTGARTKVWTEVINRDAAASAGWRSAIAEIQIDCRGMRYRETSRTVYAAAGRQGEARRVPPARAWETVEPDTTMGTTLAEACSRATGP